MRRKSPSAQWLKPREQGQASEPWRVILALSFGQSGPCTSVGAACNGLTVRATFNEQNCAQTFLTEAVSCSIFPWPLSRDAQDARWLRRLQSRRLTFRHG